MLSFLSALCLACNTDGLQAPGQMPDTPVTPNVAPITDSVCARLTADLTSATAVTVTYPTVASCVGGYVLIKGANATWSQSGGRTLTLKLRVRNRTPVSQPSPVRVILPPSGVRVVTPAGTASSTVVGSNADSTLADGSKLWRFGSTGQLASSDSTATKTLTFTVQAPATKVQLTFETPGDTSRPAIPAGPSPVGNPSQTVVAPGSGQVAFYRTLFWVKFRDGTSGATIRAVLDRHRARIIGGGNAVGDYALLVPDPGTTWAAYMSVRDLIAAEPSVEFVASQEVAPDLGPSGRLPSDSTGFGRSSWLSPTDTTSSFSSPNK